MIEPLETIPCMWCGKPTGMLPLDPWLVPPGCRATLIATCGECMRERELFGGELGRRFAGIERPEVEPPPPGGATLETVMVLRHRGAFAAIAITDGKVIDQCGGWSTRGGAFEHGARALAEYSKATP